MSAVSELAIDVGTSAACQVLWIPLLAQDCRRVKRSMRNPELSAMPHN
jgi:hypothetical protein